jgi:hypothetical protein
LVGRRKLIWNPVPVDLAATAGERLTIIWIQISEVRSELVHGTLDGGRVGPRGYTADRRRRNGEHGAGDQDCY